MTEKEAIKQLKKILNIANPYTSQAVKMAIKALESEDHEPKVICISTPDGITNGDIMRKVFPDFDISEYFDEVCLCKWINGTYKSYRYHREWWDAPYRPKKKSDLILLNKEEQILNKIMDDIKTALKEPQYQHVGDDWKVGLIMAEDIIDKYKENESEK